MRYPRQRVHPGPGQESVWDYPRPPRLEQTSKLLEVWYSGKLIAKTNRGFRVLETSHPPGYYFPSEDVNWEFLEADHGSSFCEWKGNARYYAVKVGDRRAAKVAWAYPEPKSIFVEIKDAVAFYAGPMERCLVDGELVTPQPGLFYGGWITSDVVGPFKGADGTMGW